MNYLKLGPDDIELANFDDDFYIDICFGLEIHTRDDLVGTKWINPIDMGCSFIVNVDGTITRNVYRVYLNK